MQYEPKLTQSDQEDLIELQAHIDKMEKLKFNYQNQQSQINSLRQAVTQLKKQNEHFKTYPHLQVGPELKMTTNFDMLKEGSSEYTVEARYENDKEEQEKEWSMQSEDNWQYRSENNDLNKQEKGFKLKKEKFDSIQANQQQRKLQKNTQDQSAKQKSQNLLERKLKLAKLQEIEEKRQGNKEQIMQRQTKQCPKHKQEINKREKPKDIQQHSGQKHPQGVQRNHQHSQQRWKKQWEEEDTQRLAGISRQQAKPQQHRRHRLKQQPGKLRGKPTLGYTQNQSKHYGDRINATDQNIIASQQNHSKVHRVHSPQFYRNKCQCCMSFDEVPHNFNQSFREGRNEIQIQQIRRELDKYKSKLARERLAHQQTSTMLDKNLKQLHDKNQNDRLLSLEKQNQALKQQIKKYQTARFNMELNIRREIESNVHKEMKKNASRQMQKNIRGQMEKKIRRDMDASLRRQIDEQVKRQQRQMGRRFSQEQEGITTQNQDYQSEFIKMDWIYQKIELAIHEAI